MEDGQGAFTRLWSTVQRALVQSGASGREWACLAALMRFQEDRSGPLCMSVERIAKETGLTEGSVRQGLHRLLARRYLLSDGHELPVLAICEKSSRGRATTYRLCVPRVESPALRILSKGEARDEGERAARTQPGRKVRAGHVRLSITARPGRLALRIRSVIARLALRIRTDGITDSGGWCYGFVTHIKLYKED